MGRSCCYLAAPRSRHHGDLLPKPALVLVHWQDYLQGLGIPEVISTRRLVPAEAAAGLWPGLGSITRAGTAMTICRYRSSPLPAISYRRAILISAHRRISYWCALISW